MGVELRIEGSDQLESLARRLKAAGDGDLRRELFAGVQRATKPLREAAKDSALESLPSRGGLNRVVAQSKLSTRTRGGGRNPGVTVAAAQRGLDLRAMDRGRLRHPVFGNRRVWVTQTITPGWFTKPLDAGAPLVRRELLEVMDSVARRVAGG